MTKLEALRRANNWSQRDLAQLVGVSSNAISAIECHRRYCYPKLRRALSELYGLPEEALFTATGEPRSLDYDAVRRLVASD